MTDVDDIAGLARLVRDGVARGEPAHLVLMHLLSASRTEVAARAALAQAGTEAPAVAAVAAVWQARSGAWATVKTVLSVALDEAESGSPGAARDPVGHWRQAFDRLAGGHPEAGVALYALGDPALLAAASREIVAALQAWGDLRPGQRVLDLGCGIGRLSEPMAEAGAAVLGVDISAGMLVEARRRHRRPGLLFAQVSGRDLAALADDAVDLVVAADVLPYLVDAGEAVAAAHLAELARVLRRGGRLVIANISYRGDAERDAADLAAWAAAAGLALLAPPARPFTLWDGLVARLERRA